MAEDEPQDDKAPCREVEAEYQLEYPVKCPHCGEELEVVRVVRLLRTKVRAGHLGRDRVTAQNLKVVMVDAERNLIGVHGAVPGGKGSIVVVNETRKQ